MFECVHPPGMPDWTDWRGMAPRRRAKISNEFMSAVERGAKLPSLDVLERIAAGLRVQVKDLFNFDRTAYRKLEPLSRETLDIASALEQLPVTERHRLLRIIRAFTGRATIRDDIPHSGSSLTSKTLERI